MSEHQWLMDKLPLIRSNPTAIQQMLLREVELLSQGSQRVVDATNPFTLLLEAGAHMAASGVIHSEAVSRKLYPSNSQDFEDLYLHMADVDYLDIFSKPSSTTFTILIAKDEVGQKAVKMNNSTTRRLQIPRHTEFTVAETAFTMQYPIDIDVLAHGGITVTYNAEKLSPIEPLQTNIVDWYLTRVQGIDFIRIDVPVQQIRITSATVPINKSTGFKKTYEFEDQFYHCRVFHKTTGGVWEEMKTTHTEQVYDPNTLTAALRVVGNDLHVSIPQIYLSQNALGSEVRVDIYTTKGALEMSLDSYDVSTFSAVWNDWDNDHAGKFSAPLNSFGALAVFSDQQVLGGHDGLSLDELRERVIMNSLGDINLPITNAQIDAVLSNNGFDVVKNLDTVTNREFLATRHLPVPEGGVSSASATMLMLQSTLEILAGADQITGDPIYPVRDNGNRLTLLPDTVYRDSNGVLEILSTGFVDGLKAQNAEQLAQSVNSDSLLYSPFFYVLDINDDEFDTRAYDLDSPEILSKYFVAENDTAQVQAGVAFYDIYPDDTRTGFYLDVVTKSDDNFKAASYPQPGGTEFKARMQLSYIPPGSADRAYMTAEHLAVVDDDELLFRFHIKTDYDITADHQLNVSSFKTLDDSNRILPMLLDGEFDVSISIYNHEPGGMVYTIKDVIDEQYLNPTVEEWDEITNPNYITSWVAVAHEKVRIRLGEYLENLWTLSRSVIGPEEYQTYASTQYLFHEIDVYERDSQTGNIVWTWDAGTSTLVYNKLWRGEGDTDRPTGDPVLNNAGTTAWEDWYAINSGSYADRFAAFDQWWDVELTETQRNSYQIVKWEAGDVVLDIDGLPVSANTERDVLRQTELLLIDGRYYFADVEDTVAYRESIAGALKKWITEDIADVSSGLLEQTEIYFYPKSTVGTIRAFVGEGVEVDMNAEQSLVVTYHVDADVYADTEIRQVLENTALAVIDERLSRKTVSQDDIVTKLKTEVGENVISVKVEGLFSDVSADTATLKDGSARFVIGKELIALKDGKLGVRDAVTVNFIKHTG